MKKSELNDYADGRIRKITSIPYNKRRDAQLECNGGQPAGCQSERRTFMVSTRGVAVINPAAQILNSQPPGCH